LIAVDSSVLVRYLVQDDPDQARLATSFLEDRLSEDQPGFVSAVVLVETIWVLRRGYRRSAADVAAAVTGLLRARQVHVEHRDAIAAALGGDGADLADRIILELGRKAGCSETVTFDRRFARLDGVKLLRD
jgi:predicted nucleic-acid-binding protein